MPILTTLRMRLPVWPGERAAAQTRGEVRHRVEHLMDVGHHVGAVDLDVGAARRAQRHVQHGAAFGRVDLLAGEHRVAPVRATPRSSARRSSSCSVSSVMRFLE